MTVGDYPAIELLEADVDKHGEVHVVIEEAGAGGEGDEIEVRAGTTRYDYEMGVLRINGENTDHRVRMDSVVRWYLPREFSH
jgi:hypothetical protein